MHEPRTTRGRQQSCLSTPSLEVPRTSPTSLKQAREYAGVELFVQRATASDREVAFSDASAEGLPKFAAGSTECPWRSNSPRPELRPWAAASSIARGIPSSRRQISAIPSALASLKATSRSEAVARCTNSSTPAYSRACFRLVGEVRGTSSDGSR